MGTKAPFLSRDKPRRGGLHCPPVQGENSKAILQCGVIHDDSCRSDHGGPRAVWRACVRGMRIRVSDVLDLLANGLTPEQVIEELPDLEVADVQACLRYASRHNGEEQ